MWNAGVIGTPNTKNLAEIKLALEICDAICAAKVKTHINEQFAFSVAMQKMYPLTAAENCIAHYWSNKEEWNTRITSFFTEAFLKELTPQQVMESMYSFDFKTIAVEKKSSNTVRRLHKLIDRSFKKPKTEFIQ